MSHPTTKITNVEEVIGGVSVSDPYRWLEDGSSPEVKSWVARQNEHTLNALSRDAAHATFRSELEDLFHVGDMANPIVINGIYFWRERKADEEQMVLYAKFGLNGSPIMLVDPNEINTKGTATISFWEPSCTAKYIAYGICDGGDEMAVVHIKEVSTNTDLTETIPQCRYPQVRWLNDDSGFYYARHPDHGTVPESELHLYAKVYFHRLGTDYKSDVCIFGEGRPKDDMHELALSYDDRYLAIEVAQSWLENEVYIFDTHERSLKKLETPSHTICNVHFLRDRMLISTNYLAERSRILSAPLTALRTPVAQWEEFIPEHSGVIENINISADKILIEYQENAHSQVRVYNHEGVYQSDIALPPFSSLFGISTINTEAEFFYSITSFTFPRVVMRYDPQEHTMVQYYAVPNPINPKDFEVTQEWCVSRDGARVPMFIIRKRQERDGLQPRPTILYGYGGFKNGITPYFMKSFVPWLSGGGTIVVANIRGGNEFGDAWHKAGIREHKQNSYNDFIAAAEFLIEKGYTTAAQLGIHGGSNGGLLVCAVAMQRPELFRAVAAAVPLTDMVRFPKFGMAIRWMHEYGNPEDAQELKHILKWSPYHNIKSGVSYPHFYISTGENDSRVDPLHSRKMTARLQAVAHNCDVYLHTQIATGHGQGKSVSQAVDEIALLLTFFTKKLKV